MFEYIQNLFKSKGIDGKSIKDTFLEVVSALRASGITDVSAIQVAAQIIMAEGRSPYPIVAMWRPVIGILLGFTCFLMLILAYCGIMPPDMNSTQIAYFHDFTMMLMGYGGLRTGEKILDGISTNLAASSMVKSLSTTVAQRLQAPSTPLSASQVGSSPVIPDNSIKDIINDSNDDNAS